MVFSCNASLIFFAGKSLVRSGALDPSDNNSTESVTDDFDGKKGEEA